MKGRVEQNDTGMPVPAGAYAYWQKYVPGAEHPQLVRAPRRAARRSCWSTGAALAKGRAYFKLGDDRHSPDHRLYAYLTDLTGAEEFQPPGPRSRGRARSRGRRCRRLTVSPGPSDSRTCSMCGSTPIIARVWSIATPSGATPRPMRSSTRARPQFRRLDMQARSGRFIMISATTLDTSEVRLIDAAHPERAPVVVSLRQAGLQYDVDDWGDQLVIRTNADGAEDFKIVTAPPLAPGRENWRDLVPHKPGRYTL